MNYQKNLLLVVIVLLAMLSIVHGEGFFDKLFKKKENGDANKDGGDKGGDGSKSGDGGAPQPKTVAKKPKPSS